jgi:hypothetical protein
VQVEHDPRVATGETPAEQNRWDVVRAVHEHRVRLEVAQLSRDAHRQREMEGNSVYQPWPDRLDEVKRVVVGKIRLGRACEHAHLGDALERLELLAIRVRQRNAISGSRDEQNAQRTSPRFVSGDQVAYSRRVLLRRCKPLFRSCLRD